MRRRRGERERGGVTRSHAAPGLSRDARIREESVGEDFEREWVCGAVRSSQAASHL